MFRLGSHAPVPYEPPKPEKGGIKALLEGLMAYGWQGVYEGETLIALERDKANVSLEPAGQFELSGAPLETIHEISAETRPAPGGIQGGGRHLRHRLPGPGLLSQPDPRTVADHAQGAAT